MASANGPSAAGFKLLPALEGNNQEHFKVFTDNLKHFCKLSGKKFGDILDMNITEDLLSEEHDGVIAAVIALSIGDGKKCPSAKEIVDKVLDTIYSGRAVLVKLPIILL